MEDEKFISGYCRTLDCSRMVTAELENGILTDADCLYPDCPYVTNCTVAKELDTLKK